MEPLHNGKRSYDIRDILNCTPISAIMTAPVVTINKDENFSAVEKVFVHKHIRHLPVVNDSGSLVGLMTKRDLYKTLSPRKSVTGQIDASLDKIIESEGVYYSKELLDSFILEKVMIHDVCTLTEDCSVGQALRLMYEHKFGSVIIVDDGRKVQGIITRFDVLRLANQYVEEK